MQARAATLPAETLETLVEVTFPAWPTPILAARALAPAAPRDWATQREAGASAAFVAGLVGIPAFVAVGTLAAVFALTSAVLLAPVVAVGLAWLAWRSNVRPSPQASP